MMFVIVMIEALNVSDKFMESIVNGYRVINRFNKYYYRYQTRG